MANGTPTADISSFTDEQKRLFSEAEQLGSGVDVIDSTALEPTEDITVPEIEAPPTTDVTSGAAFGDTEIQSVDEILAERARQTEPEQVEGGALAAVRKTLESLRERGATVTDEGIEAPEVKQEFEREFGVVELEENLQKSRNRLLALQAERGVIPLEIQQEFTGRGATRAGVQPKEIGRLRMNAIDTLRESAISAQLRGDLTLAEKRVDRAMDLEFADEEAEIAYQKQILELNRPELERINEQKTREYEARLNERERLLDERKLERKAINDIVLTATQAGIDNDFLQKAFGSETFEGAASTLAGEFSRLAQEDRLTQQQLNDLKRRSLELEIQKKVKELSQPPGTLDAGQMFNAETKLSDTYDDRTGDYKKVSKDVDKIRIGLEEAKRAAEAGESINAASQAVLVTYQKILDPDSVVRESEYARSPDGLSFISRIEGMVANITQGGAGVTADDLEEFSKTSELFLTSYEDSAIEEAQLVMEQAGSYGLNIRNIIPQNVFNLMEDRFRAGAENTPIGGTFTIGAETYRKVSDEEFEKL
jgi:hypothetical protein